MEIAFGTLRANTLPASVAQRSANTLQRPLLWSRADWLDWRPVLSREQTAGWPFPSFNRRNRHLSNVRCFLLSSVSVIHFCYQTTDWIAMSAIIFLDEISRQHETVVLKCHYCLNTLCLLLNIVYLTKQVSALICHCVTHTVYLLLVSRNCFFLHTLGSQKFNDVACIGGIAHPFVLRFYIFCCRVFYTFIWSNKFEEHFTLNPSTVVSCYILDVLPILLGLRLSLRKNGGTPTISLNKNKYVYIGYTIK